jgi:hypothetical protein
MNEAMGRDPARHKQWVALVDGNETQIRIFKQLARKHAIALTLVLDVIHVIGYLWKAALAFHGEGTPALDPWLHERVLRLLRGEASQVAAGMRRSATLRHLSTKDRVPIDKCANYLLKYKQYLAYDEYLKAGLPIATGIIEGACRHLVKDRMDLTGARWSLAGAEAVLRLRALHASHDFDDYWEFHQRNEYQRNHVVHYADGVVPDVRHSTPSTNRPMLQRIK